jgi:hypothetical protein
MQAAPLPYGDAVERYYELLKAEGYTMIDIPGEGTSYREGDGWRLRNVRGDLAYVLDSGQLGDLRDLPVDDV